MDNSSRRLLPQRKLIWIIAFTALLAPRTVSAKGQPKVWTFPDFVEHAIKTGWSGALQHSAAEAMGFGHQAPPAKLLEFDAPAAADGLDHLFWVVLKDTTTAAPLTVCMMAREFSGDYADTYYMKVSTAGTLERSVFMRGKRDRKGHLIWGSGMPEETELDSRDIRWRFSHELDFWLKGRYRKPRPPARKSNNPGPG